MEMYDQVPGRGVEPEVGVLLYALVRMFKPKVCVETGTYIGDSAEWIGRGLRDNCRGTLVTCDVNSDRVEAARRRLQYLPNVEVREAQGIDVLAGFESMDFVHIDSGQPETVRKPELLSLSEKNIAPGGVICWHDACASAECLYDAFAPICDWPHLVLPSYVGMAVFVRPE